VNHYLLTRLARTFYGLGISLCIVAALLSIQFQPGTAASLQQGLGDCGSGYVEKTNSNGEIAEYNGTEVIGSVYVKSGSQNQDDGSCYLFTEDGSNGCYAVSGLGTTSVTVTHVGTGPDCKEISHVEFYAAQVTATPPPATATATSTSTATATATLRSTLAATATATFTPTATWTSTATNSPTATATHTATATATATATNTATASATNTATPTATWTTAPGDTAVPTATATSTSTPTATPTVFDPGDPTATPLDSSTTAVPAVQVTPGATATPPATLPPPSVPTGAASTPALVPETGIDLSNGLLSDLALPNLLMNLGIGLIGLGLVFQGVAGKLRSR